MNGGENFKGVNKGLSFKDDPWRESGARDLNRQFGGHCFKTKSTIERIFYILF